jgi:hypothetical protein
MSRMKPEPRVVLTLHISPDLHEDLRREATEKHTSLSAVARVRLTRRDVDLKKAA